MKNTGLNSRELTKCNKMLIKKILKNANSELHLYSRCVALYFQPVLKTVLLVLTGSHVPRVRPVSDRTQEELSARVSIINIKLIPTG